MVFQGDCKDMIDGLSAAVGLSFEGLAVLETLVPKMLSNIRPGIYLVGRTLNYSGCSDIILNKIQ